MTNNTPKLNLITLIKRLNIEITIHSINITCKTSTQKYSRILIHFEPYFLLNTIKPIETARNFFLGPPSGEEEGLGPKCHQFQPLQLCF